MSEPATHRARSSEAKKDRERTIMEAARALVSARGARSVTLTGVAAEIGMHKSGLLRYFETREQILLLLAAECWIEWSAVVCERLRELRHPASAAAVAAAVADSLVEHPTFCDLLAHVPLSYERHVSIESVRRYKLTTGHQLETVSEELHQVWRTSEEQGADFVAAAVSLAGAFWQMATPAEDVAMLYRTDADLVHAAVDVRQRLTRILAAQLEGYRMT